MAHSYPKGYSYVFQTIFAFVVLKELRNHIYDGIKARDGGLRSIRPKYVKLDMLVY